MTVLEFAGGYRAAMCYRTPDGDVGQANAGTWASGQAGLLWFFDHDNAEVLVKVLDGCRHNGYRWVFVAPVTTLEFSLWITGPNGQQWTHSNSQGRTASAKSDLTAFSCANETESALPHYLSSGGYGASSRSLTGDATGCTPTTAALRFEGGYEVSMCYRTPDGEVGQAESGIWASGQAGLLWFFERGNAEVLVKVLDGCSHNGHRWVFVAPVTTLEFNLSVTASNGRRWTHSNTQGQTASTKSDLAAFSCADDDGSKPDPTEPPPGPLQDHHAALTAGLPERPFVNTTVGGNEGSTWTVGTLRLGLNPNAFPVIVSESGDRTDVLAAGSRLGEGRIVAFSGQDFLGPNLRATLLGHFNTDRLVANAVRWAGRHDGAAPLRVLVDNPLIADALEAQGLERAEVAGRRDQDVRDWSAGALDDMDVVVVLTNHWGTPTLVPEFVPHLRRFVERGGGLVVAGSALHWDWWIRERFGRFTGNALVEGAGISWNLDFIEEIESASARFDLRTLTPDVVWRAYGAGERLDGKQLSLLPGLFSAALELGRIEELDSALVRLARETPALPTSSAAPGARLAASVAETLGPHEWPATHPWAGVFPGLPAKGAHRVDGTVVVDGGRSGFPANASRRERHLPIGFYAPPSASVAIEVPARHATGELAVSVGELYDNLGESYAAQSVWRRPPWLRREFPLADRRTAVTNAYGGSIALIVPADYSGTIPVTVRGGIPMAVYTAGRSTAGAWFADLEAGAPQAVIQKAGGIRLVISAENARSIADPHEVAVFWDGFQRHHADLAGEPSTRAYESHWIFDPQVGWGYANAGRLRINYPLHGEHWALLPGTAKGREYIAELPDLGPQPVRIPPATGYSPEEHGVDWWLFGHELGHQWQSEDWTGHGITEVGVNLFTMYTLNNHVYSGDNFNVDLEQKTNGCAAPLNHAVLANRRWSTADDCEKLALYRQLISEFGWDRMKAVFYSYYDPAYPRSTYGGSLDGFAIRFSAIVRRDLVAFFGRWEYPLSDSAADTIRSFGFEQWLPTGW